MRPEMHLRTLTKQERLKENRKKWRGGGRPKISPEEKKRRQLARSKAWYLKNKARRMQYQAMRRALKKALKESPDGAPPTV